MPARRRRRTTGSTTARGYGHHHQQLRKRLLAAWHPGQPCARCGKPLTDPAAIDLGHTEDRAAYTGLEHRSCNRGAGAEKTNTQRRRPRRPWPLSRAW